MQIDYALILGAGLGTRMGEIGKILPKILWPVYFKTMFELQIKYCQERGIKKIYLNTHFLHEEIKMFLEKSEIGNDVILLHEDVLLGSGGAIHNLASQKEINYEGVLLLVNGDQFLFFDDLYWERALEDIKTKRAVLFGIKVSGDVSYNETIVTDGKLVEVKKKSKDSYVTYSGLGLLNLKGLVPLKGISSFFDTVANYKNENIGFITPLGFEYWDFGTSAIYANNIFKLKSQSENLGIMEQFLEKNKAFCGEKDKFVNFKLRSIDLDCAERFIEGHIQYAGLSQKF